MVILAEAVTTGDGASWLDVLTVVLPVLAAFGGVWITQRGERQRGKEGRLDAEKLKGYAELSAWLSSLTSFVYTSNRGHSTSWPPLDAGTWARVQVLGSETVIHAGEKLLRKTAELQQAGNSQPERSNPLSAAHIAGQPVAGATLQIDKVTASMIQALVSTAQHQIRREIGTSQQETEFVHISEGDQHSVVRLNPIHHTGPLRKYALLTGYQLQTLRWKLWGGRPKPIKPMLRI